MSVRVVYDCMLFFQEASRPARVHRTFQLVSEGVVTLCMSPEVLAEVRDVLTRPEHRAKFPALTPEIVDAFLARYLRGVSWFPEVPDTYAVAADLKDSRYVNLALAASVPFLVSSDHHLLDLMDATKPHGADFRARFPGLTIQRPADFVRAFDSTRVVPMRPEGPSAKPEP